MANERVAVITAGGSGMGAAAARRLAQDGFRVAILSSSGKGEALAAGARRRRRHRLEPVERRSAAAGRRGDGALGPHRRAGQQRRPRPARAGPRAHRRAVAHRAWRSTSSTSCGRPASSTPIMQAQGGGAIVNISTFAAFEPDPVFPTCGVFRAGLAAFTKLFADRYAAGQHPHEQRAAGLHRQPAGEARSSASAIPMGRYGTRRGGGRADRLPRLRPGAYITGQNIRVDGGITRAV